MATYQNSRELAGKVLKWEDTLVFQYSPKSKALYYVVASDHLAHEKGDNTGIFLKLGLNTDAAKSAFCAEAYGYPARFGAFPTCKEKDYSALTRVAMKIFIELEKRKEKNMPETYKYSADLAGKVLRKNDRVVFNFGNSEFLYRAVTDHLSCRAKGVTNALVFDKLGFMPGEKERFCSELYGYPAKEGAFPAVKPGDYAALTRVAIALLEKIEKPEEKDIQTYTSSSDLAGKELCYGDKLVFSIDGEQLVYKVMTRYLGAEGGRYNYLNDAIFTKLGMSLTQRRKLCLEAYGYKTGSGTFPTCKRQDYKALTRIAMALFQEVEKRNINKEKEVMPKYKTEAEKVEVVVETLETVENVERVITWENLDVDDLIVDKEDKYFGKVLAKCGKAFLLSYWDKEKSSSELERAKNWFTLYELQEFAELPKPEEKIAELTLEEIEELLGSKIKIVEK